MYTTEFVDIPLSELLTRVQTLKHQGFRFIQLCAETTTAGIDLLYTFYDETCDNALNLCIYGINHESEVPSIQGLYFAAFSYENETHDLYGVNFINMQLNFGVNAKLVGLPRYATAVATLTTAIIAADPTTMTSRTRSVRNSISNTATASGMKTSAAIRPMRLLLNRGDQVVARGVSTQLQTFTYCSEITRCTVDNRL